MTDDERHAGIRERAETNWLEQPEGWVNVMQLREDAHFLLAQLDKRDAAIGEMRAWCQAARSYPQGNCEAVHHDGEVFRGEIRGAINVIRGELL